MEKKFLATIIVLNYNGKQFLEKCLTSIQNLSFPKKDYSIFFVDNASKDGAAPFVREIFPTIPILEHTKNYGFCLGNNLAIQKCTSKYVLLLNNDLHIHKDFLKNLVEVMESDPQIGCCGGDEYEYDDIVFTPKGVIRETSWIGAGATIYRKKALDQTGLFDPTFFFNCEDIDISWRLKLHNWKIFQNEKAIFYHAGKNKKITISDIGLFYAWRNRIFLLLKFASISQIRKSLFLYASLLFKINKEKPIFSKSLFTDNQSLNTFGRKNDQTQQIHGNNSLMNIIFKLYFIVRVFFSVFIHIPEMLLKRYQLKRIISNQKEVDSWVDYVDITLKK